MFKVSKIRLSDWAKNRLDVKSCVFFQQDLQIKKGYFEFEFISKRSKLSSQMEPQMYLNNITV